MERLQKMIAQSGVCSRRKAEELIVDNKVKVNGEVVNTLGTKVGFDDIIEVNGKRLKLEKKEYFILNKPKEVISSTKDQFDRTSVVDLIPTAKTRIFPIGRLDYDTTGLIILTNDGELANLMMHPSSRIEKSYVAVVKGSLSKKAIMALEKGVEIDGYKTRPAKVKILEKDDKRDIHKIRITISEGKNHQVKKMCAAVGLDVKKLHRDRYSEFDLNNLPSGEYRKIKTSDIEELKYIIKNKNK